jgi:hypothetical protein
MEGRKKTTASLLSNGKIFKVSLWHQGSQVSDSLQFGTERQEAEMKVQ